MIFSYMVLFLLKFEEDVVFRETRTQRGGSLFEP